jgi:quinol-cytochrome oxidoreductase complex cytochrome b subunit
MTVQFLVWARPFLQSSADQRVLAAVLESRDLHPWQQQRRMVVVMVVVLVLLLVLLVVLALALLLCQGGGG